MAEAANCIMESFVATLANGMSLRPPREDGFVSPRGGQRQTLSRGHDLQGLLFRFLRSLRHPRGDAEGRGAHAHLSQFHVPQPAPVQGQGGAGRGQRHRNPLHVRSQGRRQEGHRDRVLEHLRLRRENRQGQQTGPCGFHHQGQGGGGGAAGGESRHHHQRVDGLLSVLRVHAQHCHLCPGQVADPGRADLPRPRHALRDSHRGQAVQGLQNPLVGERVRLRHVLHQGRGHQGAPGGRGGSQAAREQRLPHQGGGHLHGEGGGADVHGTVLPAGEAQRLRSRAGRLLQHRVHALPQAHRLLHQPGIPVHALEADGVLHGGISDGEERRGNFRHHHHETQRQEQPRPGFHHRPGLQGAALRTLLLHRLPHALGAPKSREFTPKSTPETPPKRPKNPQKNPKKNPKKTPPKKKKKFKKNLKKNEKSGALQFPIFATWGQQNSAQNSPNFGFFAPFWESWILGFWAPNFGDLSEFRDPNFGIFFFHLVTPILGLFPFF